MKLFDFLRRESTLKIQRLLFLAAIAGISNALVLALINSAISDAVDQQHSAQEAVLFVILISIYFVAQRHVMLTVISEVETVLKKVRIRIADKIRHCDLRPLEEMGRATIYSSVQKETTTISQSAVMLVLGVQFALLVFFTALYVAWLSIPAFLLTVANTVGVMLFFLKRGKQLRINLHKALDRENAVFDSLTNFLEGFKEIRMNNARSSDLFERYQEIADSATSIKIETQSDISSQFIISQIAFYFMVAVVVFIVPQMSPTFSETIVKTATAILFLIGPISGLVSAIPNLANASAACENIMKLESLLEATAKEQLRMPVAITEFEEISFENIVFSYQDQSTSRPFTIGPINLTIKAGEIVFISGGNGTGKSTLLKLLTALYHPMQGTICLDGQPLNEATLETYQSLFSTIFSDYHLFDRLYGLSDVEPDKIEKMIEYLELSGKTKIVDAKFETIELSGGQRKRLALLVSLLEDRPICVYDEVGANQDPAFRKRYYEEILPALKQQGKTIVAVTHDDRYFSVADRLLKMESGRIVNNESE